MTGTHVTIGVRAALLGAVALASPACGDEPAQPSLVDTSDEWGENEVPPTRDQILAAPGDYEADAVIDALVAAAEGPDTSALPRVLTILSDPREEIRWHAVLALRAIGGPEADAALARAETDDDSALVREEASRR